MAGQNYFDSFLIDEETRSRPLFELTSRSAGWVERRVFRVRQVGWILALFRGFFLAMVAVSCRQRGSSGEAPAIYTCRVVREIPHDGQAFTQGLAFENGRFYESTGLYGKSGLRVLDAETGALLGQKPLEPGYFGEGLTLFNNFLVQLTWREKTGFVYDAKTLDLLLTFSYEGEGWGLTFDGVRLIMSDGTSTLRFLDPQTFRETGCVVVRDGDAPVAGLNELEYVKGLVYANVWLTEKIAMIDPVTGMVRGWIDVGGLIRRLDGPHDVPNGIAYDSRNERLFMTGKLWPRIFEVRLVPAR